MGRRRRRRSRGGSTRRRFLTGGVLAIGGASILGGTQAFSQLRANRAASVETTADEGALLGLNIPDIAAVGVDDTELVEVINNTDNQLTASVDITDLRNLESPPAGDTPINQAGSHQFTASLDADRATGEDSVDINVTGSSPDVDIELSRTIPVPSFSWMVFDKSEYGNIRFDIQYEVDGVPSFNSIDIEVAHSPSDSTERYPRDASSGTITYPGTDDRDSNSEGDEYQITFNAYGAGDRHILNKTVTITGGDGGGEGDVGNENDPQIDWVFIDDNSHRWHGTDYDVYYRILNVDNLGEVEVTFDHENDYATESITTSQGPVGVVGYEDSEDELGFDIIVKAKDSTGFIADTVSIYDISNGENPNELDTSEPDSPTFSTLNVSHGPNGDEYVIDYSIGNDERFGEVRAQFENLNRNEPNDSVVDSSGSFTYSHGGDQHRVIIRIFEERGGVLFPVEAETYEDI